MRTRALLLLLVFVAVTATAGAWIALRDSGAPSRDANEVAVDVSSLRRGKVLPVRVELPPPDGRSVRVFFVRQPGGHVDAFLGVSTHLGCALLIPQDARFGRGFTEGPGMAPFQDPCGGSTYSLDGECVGGPCPRGLDRYVVRRTDDTASIDLTRLVAGPVAARFSR